MHDTPEKVAAEVQQMHKCDSEAENIDLEETTKWSHVLRKARIGIQRTFLKRQHAWLLTQKWSKFPWAADVATLYTDMTSQQHRFDVILMEQQYYCHISCQVDPNPFLNTPSTTLWKICSFITNYEKEHGDWTNSVNKGWETESIEWALKGRWWESTSIHEVLKG